MRVLLKKEFSLCAHPTCFVFLAFACFVFIPNYPYEVMFFFSGLSVFFVCLTARENGDAAFTCTLPVKKSEAVLARMLMCVILQIALLACAALTTTVKQLFLPAEMQVNMAGMAANTAFLGFGALILGVFNVIFFPVYYAHPEKVGKPFIFASAAEFAIIILLIVLRYAAPFFRDTLNTPDPVNIGAKVAVLCAGLALYAALSLIAVRVSAKHFRQTDL